MKPARCGRHGYYCIRWPTLPQALAQKGDRRVVAIVVEQPELLDIGRRSELEVQGKMTKDDLRADLARILPALAYESLKAMCKDLGLPGDGRDESVDRGYIRHAKLFDDNAAVGLA